MSLYEKHFSAAYSNPADSAYYWWFMFLREVEDYGPTHRLWPIFGDVRKQEFEPWFSSNEERLFYDEQTMVNRPGFRGGSDS